MLNVQVIGHCCTMLAAEDPCCRAPRNVYLPPLSLRRRKAGRVWGEHHSHFWVNGKVFGFFRHAAGAIYAEFCVPWKKATLSTAASLRCVLSVAAPLGCLWGWDQDEKEHERNTSKRKEYHFSCTINKLLAPFSRNKNSTS